MGRGTQVVRERSAKPLSVGSIPTRASKFLQLRLTRDPSLRSGFRLRAPASLTPANRLKFDSEPRLQISPTAINTRSLAALGISPAGSRFAHARKPAQVRFSPAPPISPIAIRIVDLCSPSA